MKRKYIRNFLKESITREFGKYDFSFIYIGGNLDSLFAVTTISFPMDDVRYLEFKGIEVNEYRDVEEFVHVKELVKTLIKQELRVYKISSETEWVYQQALEDYSGN